MAAAQIVYSSSHEVSFMCVLGAVQLFVATQRVVCMLKQAALFHKPSGELGHAVAPTKLSTSFSILGLRKV